MGSRVAREAEARRPGGAAEERDERWRRLVEHAPDAILIHQDDRIIFANHQAARLFGADTPGALIGITVWRLVHPEDLPRARARTRRVLETFEPQPPAELRFLRLDGSSFIGEGRPSAVRENGRPALLAIIRDVTERRRTEQALRESEQRLRDYAELASDWFWTMGPDLRFTWFSDNLEAVLGIPPRELLGRTRAELMDPDMDPAVAAAHLRQLERREPFRDFEYAWRAPDGSRRWLRVSGKPVFDADGSFMGYRGTGRDITAWKTAQLARVESEERYRRLVETSPDAILIHRGGVITFANRRAAELLAAACPDDLLGRHVLEFVAAADHDRIRRRWAELERAQALEPAEVEARRLDGETIYLETRAVAILDAGEPAVLVIGRDVTERRRAEERLDFLAHHDPLTSLPNRLLFHDRLQQALAFARRSEGRVGLLLVDLDGFKGINDTLGHTVGDALLVAAAERLRNVVRECDTVSRLDGDEFAVILPGIPGAEGVQAVASRILRTLGEPFRVRDHLCRMSASIGIAIGPDDGGSGDELLAAADLALQAAKTSRRGRVLRYAKAMRRAAERRRTIERALRAHLADGALELHYQPVVDLQSGRTVAVEALVRWPGSDPERVSPEVFVALAEECGLSAALTEQVLRRACREIGALRRETGLPLRLAVNLSPRELGQSGTAKQIVQILGRIGFPPQALELEITERVLLETTPAVRDNLAVLERAGIGLAVDDFGTGYSSLLYLKRFPIHRLKLDRSFVSGLPDDTEDTAIVRAVLTLARALDIPVLAEGIETEAQRDFLRDAGCIEGQGYLWSPPVPLASLQVWLADRDGSVPALADLRPLRGIEGLLPPALTLPSDGSRPPAGKPEAPRRVRGRCAAPRDSAR